jgi:bacterioferritin-associated ferredoxin
VIVCFCAATTDRDVRRLREEGCRSVRAIARACGAGAGCGTCAPELRRLLDAERQDPPADVALALAAK